MTDGPYAANSLAALFHPSALARAVRQPQPQSALAEFAHNALYGAALGTRPDEYLRRLLAREAPPPAIFGPAVLVQMELDPIIKDWAGSNLLSVSPSGSYAKGTANHSGTDVDLFISLAEDTPHNLGEIYDKLDSFMRGRGFATRRQNVSIGVTVGANKVDLVPGRRQNLLTGDHSLYRRKADTWTKTNIARHVLDVQASGRLEEIRIVKLWRDQHGLAFPSFYLELTVIQALCQTFLTAAPFGSLADNVWKVLHYLRDDFAAARVVDPANTNNIISDDLTAVEKQAVKAAAIKALSANSWSEIVT